MKKIVVIGDIHGREIWKDIVKAEWDADKFVFLGDYVDSHEKIGPKQQMKVLNEILDLKEANPDKVVLLRGNHCYRYAFSEGFDRSTGFSRSVLERFPKERYVANTQWIYVKRKIIFSHAGISQVWMDTEHVKSVDEVNGLNYSHYWFSGSIDDHYGTSPEQGPLWIRPKTLVKVAIEGYDQVVGHTPSDGIDMLKSLHGDHLVFCDTLDQRKYLVIVDEKDFIEKTI